MATNGMRETNGASHARVSSFAVAGAVPYDDPMDRVLGLDAKTSGFGAWFGFTSGSTVLLVAFGVFASFMAYMRAIHPPAAASAVEIEVVREEPPPPPPEPVKEDKPEPPPAARLPRDAPPPPPALAQAAKVLTQEPTPEEPVDMTNTIVQGNADSFAGGMTASNGTNTNAVHALPPPGGVAGGTGSVAAPPAPPPGPDRSRKLVLTSGGSWDNCPFPPEADTAQIDDAWVTLQVEVGPDGRPSAVRVTADPGNGFGREARRFALNKHYQPALDHDGNPTSATASIRVHFER
jgi:protein TonB